MSVDDVANSVTSWGANTVKRWGVNNVKLSVKAIADTDNIYT